MRVHRLSVLLASPLFVAAVQSVPACYNVPVQPDLKDYAQFTVDQASWEATDAGQITINYQLPEDIAGPNVMITLTGHVPAGDGAFFKVMESANDTTGECVKTVTNITCMLHYAGLPLDAQANEQFLNKKYPHDDKLAKRVQVMQAFAGDAVGILTLDL